MRLLKLALIVCGFTLFIIACTSQTGTNQVATTNKQATTAASPSSPVATPADQLAEARKMFAEGGVCARCHGAHGEGGEVEIDGKKVKAPSLRAGHALKHSDAELAKTITNGGDGMPKFGTRLTPEQINNLVRFIRQEYQGGASAVSTSNDNHAAH